MSATATRAPVQLELFAGDAERIANEKLPEYEALLAESWPVRPWGPILTAEIAADRLELDHRRFRQCIELWGWPRIPVRGAS
jgi:hypothetical protein